MKTSSLLRRLARPNVVVTGQRRYMLLSTMGSRTGQASKTFGPHLRSTASPVGVNVIMGFCRLVPYESRSLELQRKGPPFLCFCLTIGAAKMGVGASCSRLPWRLMTPPFMNEIEDIWLPLAWGAARELLPTTARREGTTSAPLDAVVRPSIMS